MYEIKKSKNLVEDLKISDESREIVIHVDVNLDRIARRFSVLQVEFSSAKKAALENPEDTEAAKKLGDVVISMLNMIFGETEAQKMLNFYEGKYIDLITDVFPFITCVVIPALKASSENKVKSIRSAYSKGKKGFLKK
jgi:hypothetical protein